MKLLLDKLRYITSEMLGKEMTFIKGASWRFSAGRSQCVQSNVLGRLASYKCMMKGGIRKTIWEAITVLKT